MFSALCHGGLAVHAGLIVVNAWYGKFVNDQSRRNEKAKVIDVTVPLQCLVKDSKLILTEASKVGLAIEGGASLCDCHVRLLHACLRRTGPKFSLFSLSA